MIRNLELGRYGPCSEVRAHFGGSKGRRHHSTTLIRFDGNMFRLEEYIIAVYTYPSLRGCSPPSMHLFATGEKEKRCLVIGGHGIFSRHVRIILQQARIRYKHDAVHTYACSGIGLRLHPNRTGHYVHRNVKQEQRRWKQREAPRNRIHLVYLTTGSFDRRSWGEG